MLYNIQQYVSGDSCLSCLGCCRYNSNPSIWAPNLLDEEKRALGLEKPELLDCGDSYICCFLNSENNHCRIYNQRPWECRLYPFLLNRNSDKLYLSLDNRCPSIAREINNKGFKRYREYLINYLQSPSILAVLNSNLKAFSSYPDGEILNLTELKIYTFAARKPFPSGKG